MKSRKNSRLGRRGENQALEFLLRKKYRFVERNFRIRWGEIDLLLRDPDGVLVFVEVKARIKSEFGSALEQISPTKLSRLMRVIRFYLHQNELDETPCRVDGVGIEYEVGENKELRVVKIEHVKNISGWF